ncbi:hypothetical protein K469DRAFT_681847 [Zopfia rhizophila CBS 207.26]|uniref:Uncharacterized protein n=1 Tax=Zopfia rhizophila CBS 207.26 TaxID=1314779 RepID=A0A6A6EX67_9PEZI|nr:hypothetical protein K469DRAFT_681847 [Zopfia rhizophila CBS 207.26]
MPRAIDRVAKAYSSQDTSATSPRWENIRLVDAAQPRDSEPVTSDYLHPSTQNPFAFWLFDRMMTVYTFLWLDARRKFDPLDWENNAAISDLCAVKETNEFPEQRTA